MVFHCFLPFFVSGEQCLFLHPNKPCTAFPNCAFGTTCHYLHPSCRFDGFCSRPDCPFTHVIKKPSPAQHQPEQPKVQDMILDGKAEVTPAPGTPAGTAPTITINKIHSSYSVNNVAKRPDAAAAAAATGATSGGSGEQAASLAANKFSLSNVGAVNTFSQMRMPRAAAPSESPGFSFPLNWRTCDLISEKRVVRCKVISTRVPSVISCKKNFYEVPNYSFELNVCLWQLEVAVNYFCLL